MATTIGTAAGNTSTATQAFNQRKVDRNQDGTLWVAHGGQDADNASSSSAAEFHYSKDNGATWTFAGASSAVLGAHVNGSLFIDVDDYAHFVWKQTGTGGSRTAGYVYYMRGTPNAGRTAWTWSAAVALNVNQGTADYPDVVAYRDPAVSGAWVASIVMSGLYTGPTNDALYYRVNVAANGTLTKAAQGTDGLAAQADGGRLGGLYGVNTHTYPSIDFNHTGDGKTVAGGTPHLYVGWTSGTSSTAGGSGRGLLFRKAVYASGAWTWNAERTFDVYFSTGQGPTWHACMFDGTRVVVPGLLRRGDGNNELAIYERDAADTVTTYRSLLINPAATDQLQYGSASFDSAGNVYLLGRDITGANGTRKLNYRKWTRSGATLGAISTFDTTGNDTPYISARRGHKPGSSIDWVWTDGTASPYNVTFERVGLNVAPNAPTGLTPSGTTLDRANTQRFSWAFSDPDAGDTQSKYDLRYRVVGAGTWTDVTGTTPNTFHDFAAGTFAAGDYEWQVRTYDAAGVVGPYSASEFFAAASAPATPTITAPVNNETIGAQEYTATWSAPSQDAYQLRTVADNAGAADTAVVYTDSGTVVSTTARSRPVTFAVNNRNEHIQVRIRVNGLWSSYASVRVLVSYTSPAVPTIAVAANSPAAKIDVTLANPAPGAGQPTVASLDLLRREGSSGDGIRIATALPAGVFSDLTPASGVVYQYKARAVATNGTTSESAWVT